ncbi:hypothetical protein [Conexibacter sp. SYSU D00693]|uniref:hypothetical protein n=1 Tax=Conexibacter sp. SYSU D00693 TaxID=2812560 RepID=UPI00196A57A3|nr:hypothetical protein [Conexibacter sp. SYSU D00693]
MGRPRLTPRRTGTLAVVALTAGAATVGNGQTLTSHVPLLGGVLGERADGSASARAAAPPAATPTVTAGRGGATPGASLAASSSSSPTASSPADAATPAGGVAGENASGGAGSGAGRARQDELLQVNSRAGAALLTGLDLAPGASRTSEVTITNSGSLAGRFTLRETNATTSFSRGALTLTVEQVRPPRAAPLATADLGRLTPLALGRFAAGEARTYRITATLSPTAGNADQGRAATATYVWDAVADGVGLQLGR